MALVMNEMWQIFTSTGSENRIKIINLLLERPYNRNQIAKKLNLNYRTVWHHLGVLKKANLIDESNLKYGGVYAITEYFKRNKDLYERIKSQNAKNEPDKGVMKHRFRKIMQGRHLDFRYFQHKRRTTKSYYVMSKFDQSYLGTVQWERGWRQYVFYPNNECMWSWDCLNELSDFIKKLTDNWRATQKYKAKHKAVAGR